MDSFCTFMLASTRLALSTEGEAEEALRISSCFDRKVVAPRGRHEEGGDRTRHQRGLDYLSR